MRYLKKKIDGARFMNDTQVCVYIYLCQQKRIKFKQFASPARKIYYQKIYPVSFVIDQNKKTYSA